MKQIPLTQGKFAIIDDDDFEKVNQYKWYAKSRRNKHSDSFVAARNVRKDKKQITQLMHNLILPIGIDGLEIDHISNDPLDNRKVNLRLITHIQNMRNQKSFYGASKYKGVTTGKSTSKFIAQIKCNYKQIYIGRFDSEIDAALAYDRKARELFGEFANTNF
jgi:hypothetical protein